MGEQKDKPTWFLEYVLMRNFPYTFKGVCVNESDLSCCRAILNLRSDTS